MMRPAASQQSELLEALTAALSRPRAPVPGRSKMKPTLPGLTRAFGLIKGGLAVIGLATVCGAVLLAWHYDLDVPAIRIAAGENISPAA